MEPDPRPWMSFLDVLAGHLPSWGRLALSLGDGLNTVGLWNPLLLYLSIQHP
jgi:hypothetical protein